MASWNNVTPASGPAAVVGARVMPTQGPLWHVSGERIEFEAFRRSRHRMTGLRGFGVRPLLADTDSLSTAEAVIRPRT